MAARITTTQKRKGRTNEEQYALTRHVTRRIRTNKIKLKNREMCG